MARLQGDGGNILLNDIATPIADNDAATKAYVDANSGGGGDSITASGGLQRIEDDISIVDAGIDEVKLNVTNTPTAGQVLTSATDTTQFTWADPVATGITSIVNGGHIDVTTVDGVATLAFDEIFDIWDKKDWVQVNTGTPIFSNNQFLWDSATNTLTVPDIGTHTVEAIQLAVRTGMALHIRQENTTPDPSTFSSGYYQILAITVTASPDTVTLELLPDVSDIFDEPIDGNTYNYELTVLQFVTGGTLNNLSLGGLSDTDFSSKAPEDGNVLSFNSNGVWVPQAGNAQDISGNTIGQLMDVSATAATDAQVLTWSDTLSEWAPADATGGGGGGSNQDWTNAALGNFSDGPINWTFDLAGTPTDEGQVGITTISSPTTGYMLTFRQADVDTTNSVSVSAFQIGYGTPFVFATYAVADLSIESGFVNVSLVDGPLDGDDILATLPADDQALSISVTVNQFIQPDLADLPDVSTTAPTDNQVLTWNATDNLWEPADAEAGASLLNDLTDVHAPSPVDGYVIRYVDSNTRWEEHSLNDTMRLYGGIDVDQTATFTVPAAGGTHAIALGNNATASGTEAVAIGSGANATFSDAVAIGQSSQAVHTDSVALGTNALVDNAKEIRLGDAAAHVTINNSVAGNESEDNQLVSKRWVNNQISDASRVISSTANALENLTEVTASTPWDDYRIVPGTSLVPELQVHMYEFDATESQFIFYPGFLSDAITGDGANLTTGTIPDFFEEVTDIANEAEVTNAGGTAVTSLGWKYLGHDTATVWQAVSHVYTFNFEWIYPGENSDGTQNPPDVTSSLELVRLKPLSDNTYNMAMNATVIASSPTSFHNAGSLNPGDTESFTGSYEFAQQLLADGISNVENGDVFAYRMKIRYKGNGFDGATNVRLAITESETDNFVPQLGIRHVGRDYSLTLEDSGDLQWTDHGSADETSLLLIENTDSGPVIPAAALGLTEGNGIDITDKSIAVQISGTDSGLTLDSTGLAVTGGNAIDVTSVGVNVVLNANSGLSINGGDGLSLDAGITELNDTEINEAILQNNQVLAWNIDVFEGNAWRALSFDVGLLGDTVLSNPQDGQVLTYESSDQTWRNHSVPAATTTLAALTDTAIATPTDGQILAYDSTSQVWENTSLSGNHSFTAGDGLSFNADGTVLNSVLGDTVIGTPTASQVLAYDAGQSRWENTTFGILPYSNVSFNTNDAGPVVGPTATRSVTIGPASSSTASNATTIGHSATGNGLSSTTLGDNANGAGNNSVSVGHDSDATNVAAVAIGDSSGATNIGSIAIGSSAIASGNRSTAMGNAASATADSGVSIGNGAGTGGARAIAIGDDPSTGTNALGIAIGERARVTGTRGISIGSSSNSADADADFVTAAQNAVAIGRAVQATATGSLAIGDGASSTLTNGIALGTGASSTHTNGYAIGTNAASTEDNSTTFGTGTSHSLYAGSREVLIANEQSASFGDITCSINNDFFSDGFNPSSTVSEELRYSKFGNLVVGRFEFGLTSSSTITSTFGEGERWTLNSNSQAMLDAFGFAVGTHALALGNFVISGSAFNSAVMGDFWLHPSTSETNVVISFRTRSSIGTGPLHNAIVSTQFNFAKF